MRSSSEVMKTKSVVRPSAIQRIVLNLEPAEPGAGNVEIGMIRLSAGLTSTVPHTTVQVANALPSQPRAEPQRSRAAAPSPRSGRLAGRRLAHHAAQTGATSLPVPTTQTSGTRAPTALNH